MTSFADKAFATIKSMAKIALQSRRATSVEAVRADDAIVVMGNGPSLNDTIAASKETLRHMPAMAVNFAALSPEFFDIKPCYYVLADPHFFSPDAAEGSNLALLRDALKHVDWPMELYVPVNQVAKGRRYYANPAITLRTFNAVGVEGFRALSERVYSSGLGMPRPRNVLIPALMIAVWKGYGTVYVAGADHSWMKTISVTDDNEVVSVQPHFYADSGHEEARVRHEYRGYRLHQIVESFAVAFRSYHDIAGFASRRGVRIVNVTPGSFIDAFERGALPD